MASLFRDDIQGLRAISVISVVIFHINSNLLPGGYLGVDVFFVISGYLILGHIWESLNKNKFNLLDFYKRRVKRLFPALFVMVLFSVILAYFCMLPSTITDFRNSVISALFYVSNFYFYSVIDYFNSDAHLLPLLHTWSLAVEEQFYLFCPVLLILIHKTKKRMAYLVFLFLAFLVLSEVLVKWNQSFAFYSPFSRFFQFLAGGLLSVSNYKNNFSKITNEIISICGIVMLITLFFVFDENTITPGINALLPTIATIAIIFSSNKSFLLYKALSNKFALLIGNSSYSIYLWHWVVIVYYKLYFYELIPKPYQAVLLVVSLLTGVLSWKYVENTTRYVTYKINPIFTSIMLSVCLTIIIFPMPGSVKKRYTEAQMHILQYLRYDTHYFRAGKCFLTTGSNNINLFNKKECLQYTPDKKNIVIMGDSHAAMFYKTIRDNVPQNYTVTQITASGCRPLVGTHGEKRCTDLMAFAFDKDIPGKRYDSVVLAGRWSKGDIKQIKSTVDYLKGYTNNIIIIGRNIDFPSSLPKLLIKEQRALKNGVLSKKILEKTSNYDEVADIDRVFMQKTANLDVHYVSTFDAFCNDSGCRLLSDDNEPVVFDANHLTQDAAAQVYNSSLKYMLTD